MISMQALQSMITDIKGKNPIDAIHLAQLHFPNAKLAWLPESDRLKQLLRVDEYVITFEGDKVDVGLIPTLNQTEENVAQTNARSKPFIG